MSGTCQGSGVGRPGKAHKPCVEKRVKTLCTGRWNEEAVLFSGTGQLSGVGRPHRTCVKKNVGALHTGR